MLGFAGLPLRQAQEALKAGRPEEAFRLLCQPEAQGLRGSSDLLRQVARAFVDRGDWHLRHEDAEAAWNDLLQAEQIGLTDKATVRLRQALTRKGLDEVRALLTAGEPTRAIKLLEQLRDRQVRLPEVEGLEEGAKGWNLAREQANRGEFAAAAHTLERVGRLLPGGNRPLEQFVSAVRDNQHHFQIAIVRLHEAVAEKKWRDVLQLSEEVLAMAPTHAEARKARARAWKAIEPATETHASVSVQAPAPPAAAPQPRFLLWIDGVGGYLVCLGGRVTLGQATPDAYVDIPLFADVSRHHASLTRETEGYVLEAVRPVQVNGRTMDRALLQSGDRVTLGGSCQLLFRQPVPVSASARIELASGHRLPLAVEGVLLMADTLVLGPGPQAHVPMPDLQQPVVLYRHKDGLGVRHAGSFQVNGERCTERGLLGPNATVTGEDFALALEPVGARMGRS